MNDYLQIDIMRGIPGSGKSTFAKTAWCGSRDRVIVSADQYFVKNGVYQFDGRKLGEAHNQCLRQFIAACLKAGVNHPTHVIVDNTNLRVSEVLPYLGAANLLTDRWSLHNFHVDESELDWVVTRNIHGVPPEKVREMWRTQQLEGERLAQYVKDWHTHHVQQHPPIERA